MVEEKIRSMQHQKVTDFLLQNNTSGIYSVISSCREILVDFFMVRSYYPFDLYGQKNNAFPFQSETQQRLMRKTISCLLSAAFGIFTNTGGNFTPIKFIRINLESFCLKTPPSKKWTSPKVPEQAKEVEPVSMNSTQSVDRHIEAESFEPLTLKKVFLLVPQFEKVESQLSMEKIKEFRYSNLLTERWFDYNPKVELVPLSNNFCFDACDRMVHDFGIQSFLMRSLAEFLQKYTFALRVRSDQMQSACSSEGTWFLYKCFGNYDTCIKYYAFFL